MQLRGPHPSETVATDVLAFVETTDEPNCKRSNVYPMSDMYWGLVATRNGFHFFHIDTDGFGTFIVTKTGAKYWILARPKDGRSFSDTDIYVGSNYAIDEMNTELWDVEAVLLTPGTCL